MTFYNKLTTLYYINIAYVYLIIDIFFPSIKIKSDYIIKKLLYAIHYIYRYDNDINYTNKKLAELIPRNIEMKKNLNHIINFINIITNISLFREEKDESQHNNFIEDAFTSCDNLFMEYSEHSTTSASSISSGSTNSSCNSDDDSNSTSEVTTSDDENSNVGDDNRDDNRDDTDDIKNNANEEENNITYDNNPADDEDKKFKEFLYKNKDFLIETCNKIENNLNNIINI